MATKIKYDFNPFGKEYANVKVKGDLKEEIISDVKDFVKEKVLSAIGEGRSPVYGDKWAALSPSYKKIKKKEAGNTKANLELFGDMLDSLDVIEHGNGLRITVGDDQMEKADGHNNFSGKSSLPLRRFIPKEKDGETFSKEIKKGIIEIVNSHLENADGSES